GQEANTRGNSEQLWDVAVGLSLIDDRRTEPHVVAASQPVVRAGASDHLEHIADALCEQKPVQIRREFDQVEQIAAPLRIDLVVEDVGERRAKHSLSATVRGEELSVRLVP